MDKPDTPFPKHWRYYLFIKWALIVGAALLMRVETTFRILGYPGLAMLCFMTAAAGGVALAVHIVLGDVRSRPRHR